MSQINQMYHEFLMYVGICHIKIVSILLFYKKKKDKQNFRVCGF